MSDKTYQDVVCCLEELNRDYPRPRIGPISLSPLSDVKTTDQWPSADKPGVYCLFDDAGILLKVGKASCNQAIGYRLRDYFYADGRPKDEYFAKAKWLATAGLPWEGAFEAPAIEEFLIGKLNPPLQRNGKKSM